jgi:hypothetical protein
MTKTEKMERILTYFEHVDFLSGVIKGLFGIGVGTLISRVLNHVVQISTSWTVGVWLVSVAFGLWLVRCIAKFFGGETNLTKQLKLLGRNIIIPILVIVVCSMAGALWYMNRELHRLQVQMVRYVLPRVMTKQQIADFGKYLKANSQPHEIGIKYLMGDVESQRFAYSMAEAFRAGNWYPNLLPLNPAFSMCGSVQKIGDQIGCRSQSWELLNHAGNSVDVEEIGPSEPQPPPSSIEEKVHPPRSLEDIVVQGLRSAGLAETGGGGGGSQTDKSTMTVYIDIRQRDSWAVHPPHFYDRRNEPPADVSDSDF